VKYLMAAFSIVEPGDDQQDPGGRAMTASSVYSPLRLSRSTKAEVEVRRDALLGQRANPRPPWRGSRRRWPP
jgi:hypothetical protein